MELTDLSDYKIPIVNDLLKKSFGPRVVGNLGGCELPLSKRHNLEVIADRRYFGFHKIIGQFDCEDGSSIRVLPKYSANAVIYAEMYESKFGKKVSIVLDPKADCTSIAY